MFITNYKTYPHFPVQKPKHRASHLLSTSHFPHLSALFHSSRNLSKVSARKSGAPQQNFKSQHYLLKKQGHFVIFFEALRSANAHKWTVRFCWLVGKRKWTDNGFLKYLFDFIRVLARVWSFLHGLKARTGWDKKRLQTFF